MKNFIICILFIPLSLFALKTETDMIKIIPVQHSSFLIEFGNTIIFIDPDGPLDKWKDFPTPDIILLTHAHNDHCNPELILNKADDLTRIIGAAVAIEKIGKGEKIKNGESVNIDEMKIEAIPAYNIAEDKVKFHPKGVGNGYILTINGKRIYIAGDTEDIPEMRNLKSIDYAFIPMNLPYTMSVEQAASAVNEFKPRIVYPYHYRGPNGKSDLNKFMELVDENSDVKVELLKWYDD